jgi:hypothetical protein
MFFDTNIRNLNNRSINEICDLVVVSLSLDSRMRDILVAFVELNIKLIKKGSSKFSEESNGGDIMFYLLLAGMDLQHEFISKINIDNELGKKLIEYVRTTEDP